MTLRRSRREKPPDMYTGLKFAKPQHRAAMAAQGMDTSELPLRKVHPHRSPEYLAWLRTQPCIIKNMVDRETEQRHVCWSPRVDRFDRPMSDPMHITRLGKGIKADDRLCVPGCRHAHRQSESQERRFEQRYGVNLRELAAEHFARFEHERNRC